MKLYDLIRKCEASALSGGRAIKDYKAEDISTKGDINVGHHAITSSADFISQAKILEVLLDDDSSFFITEENVKDERFRRKILKASEIEKMKNGRVYIVDELDGSSSKAIGYYEWSISVGCVENLKHVAGAVYAPDIYDGTLFSAYLGGGAFSIEGDRVNVSNRKINESYVILGSDNFLSKYPIHNKMISKLGDKSRTINVNGSCALALCLVASGKADALVQPPQSPWDWAAGKVILEEAGGKMIFYEINDGKIERVEKLLVEHYNPEKRAVGFVTGNREISELIFNEYLLNS